MERSNYYALLIGFGALAFGVGRLVGTSVAEPAGATAWATARAPAPVAAATPAPAPAPAAVAKAESAAPAPPEAPKPAEAAPPAPAPKAVKPITGMLPTEPGVKDDETPIPAAKPRMLPKWPKTWVPVPARGSDNPAVTVILASDFQCPVCRRVVKPMEQLIKDLGKDVRLEFWPHALVSHPRAEDAAVAALAAARQGKFWEYHDQLFVNFGRLDDQSLEDYAKEVGCNVEQWRSDFHDQTLRDQVRAMSRAADALGARGTPGFFINGRKQVGWGSYLAFKSMVEREAQNGKTLLAKGKSWMDVFRARAKSNSDKPKEFIEYFIDGVIPPQTEAAP